MNSQLSGRNQRLKELKQGLQFTSLLALCMWLVYCINHLHGHNQVSDQSSYRKFSQKYVILGRKSNSGWLLTQTSSSYVENGIFLDTTGNPSANFQKEKSDKYLVEKGSSTDNTDDQRNLEMQQKDVHGDNDGTVIAGPEKKRGGKDYDPIYVFNDENGVPPDLIDVNVSKSYA